MASASGPHILALVTEAFGGHGGIALYMRDVLRCLASLKSNPNISLFARLGKANGAKVPPNIDWHTEALAGKGSYLMSLLRLMLRGPKTDLVICGHINLLPIAGFAAWRSKAPLVLFIYGIDAWKPPSSRFAIVSLKNVDRIFSISEVTRTRFLEWSDVDPDKVTLAPNAIKLNRYGVAPPNPDLIARYALHGKQVLMTLGRLATVQRHKGFDEVLEVLPQLLARFPKLVYLIAGGGDDIARLKEKAKSLGVAGQVVFTGHVAESEKADHYRLADAFALTGFGDGFGFVLLEAMACGVPVAASVLDGSREAVLDGQLGVLVDPGDPDSLVRGLTEVLNKPKGIPKGLEYFAYPNFCDRLLTSIRPMLGART